MAISRNGPGGNGLTHNELIKLRGLVDHLHRELADVDSALGGGLQ